MRTRAEDRLLPGSKDKQRAIVSLSFTWRWWSWVGGSRKWALEGGVSFFRLGTGG